MEKVKNKKLVYIAGALRADIPTYIANCSKMIKYSERIRRSGFAVFVPCLDLMTGIVMGDMEFEDYFSNSFAILPRCDVVYLVPGWENSVGVKREIELANSLGIPVIKDILTIEEHFIEYITNHENEILKSGVINQ